MCLKPQSPPRLSGILLLGLALIGSALAARIPLALADPKPGKTTPGKKQPAKTKAAVAKCCRKGNVAFARRTSASSEQTAENHFARHAVGGYRPLFYWKKRLAGLTMKHKHHARFGQLYDHGNPFTVASYVY